MPTSQRMRCHRLLLLHRTTHKSPLSPVLLCLHNTIPSSFRILGGCCLITVIRETLSNIRFICLLPFYISQWFLNYILAQDSRYNPTDEESFTRKRRNQYRDYKKSITKGFPHVAPLLVLLLLTHLSPSHAGTEVTSLVATSEECRKTYNESSCTINSATTLTLLPAGQTVTLLLKDSQQSVLGALNFNIQSLTMNCLQKTELWLRSYEIKTEAVKRCPRMGSCKGSFCEEMSTDVILPELNYSNSFAGNSYCLGSCSFWWCKCALPTAACIFYRNYAFPLSETVFEVISCPSWEFRINLSISFALNNGSSTNSTITLSPGLTSTWNDISFTPLAISQAPTPVLNEFFLTDGKSFALNRETEIDLHCPVENLASSFNCSLLPTSCIECRPNAETLVNCQCKNFILENTISNPQRQLPLTSGKIALRSSQKAVFSESKYAPIHSSCKWKTSN